MLRDEERRAAPVSELVTNPVQHGGGRIRLLASVDDDRLLAEVIGEGGGLERSIRERDFEKTEELGTQDRRCRRQSVNPGSCDRIVLESGLWRRDGGRGARFGASKECAMLTLTPSALAAVSMLLQDPQLPDGAALRLQAGVGSDGQPAVGIVVSAPRPGDELVPSATRGGVFLAREVVKILDECVLDADIDGGNVAFMIHPQPFDGNVPA